LVIPMRHCLRQAAPLVAQTWRYVATALAGLAFSTGYPVGIVAAIAMPAIIFRQATRRAACHSAMSYYGFAIWPVIPGAHNFFGQHVSPLAAVALWAFVTTALASPWTALWSPNRRRVLWRVIAALTITSVPPLGIIGWASPLTSAGYLFPATSWLGLFGCALCAAALASFPVRVALVTGIISVLANLAHPFDAAPPTGWKAINTSFGPVAHATLSPGAEYQIAEAIQQRALFEHASVIIFPETVVPCWTAATDLFWRSTLEKLRTEHKTILVGALVPDINRGPPIPHPIDFESGISALRSGIVSRVVQKQSSGLEAERSYFNDVVIRGLDVGAFQQRIPVPIAMWNPFTTHGASLNLFGPASLVLRGERAGILICYEQVLVWPVLASVWQHPTVLIAIANDCWAAGTSIPRFQNSAVRGWSRLFGIPYLLAVNT
jgi:hypothetical protein